MYCTRKCVWSVKSSSEHQKGAFFLCFCLAEWKFLCLSFKMLLRIEIKFFGCWSIYIVEILGQRINKKKRNGWNDGWIVSSLIFGCYFNFVWVHSLTLLFHFTVVLIYGGNLGKLQKLLSLIWELFTKHPQKFVKLFAKFFYEFLGMFRECTLLSLIWILVNRDATHKTN